MHEKLFSALTNHKGIVAIDEKTTISYDTLNADLKKKDSYSLFEFRRRY